jgi:hypothetical protein
MPIILATWKVEVTRITVREQPRQEVSNTLSQPIKSWVWWSTPVTCHPSYKEYLNRRATVQSDQDINLDPI